MVTVDSEVPTSGSTIYQLTKNPGQTAPQVKNDCTDPVPRGIELTKSSVLEESDMNHAPQVSPGSSPSSVGTKDADHRGISGCRNGVRFMPSLFILIANKTVVVTLVEHKAGTGWVQ